MTAATMTRSQSTEVKPDPSHVFYLLSFRPGSMEDYQIGSYGVRFNRNIVKLFRGVHKVAFDQWKAIEEDYVCKQWLDDGTLKKVAMGSNLVRDVIEVFGSTRKIELSDLIDRTFNADILEESLEYLKEQDLLKNKSLFELRKKIEKRLDDMFEKGVPMPTYEMEHPEKAKTEGMMEFL